MFSKDEEGECRQIFPSDTGATAGCIPAAEIRFVLEHLPSGLSRTEIGEMINTVDRNGDGKISFSEFR